MISTDYQSAHMHYSVLLPGERGYPFGKGVSLWVSHVEHVPSQCVELS